MKTNKFFATAFAVLALVGFTACDQPTPTEPLELTESSITLKVGETHQLTANVAVESWTSSNAAVATVADGLVTAVSAGNAIISATAAGVTKTCVVLVEADQTQGGGGKVKGTKVWPIMLQTRARLWLLSNQMILTNSFMCGRILTLQVMVRVSTLWEIVAIPL